MQKIKEKLKEFQGLFVLIPLKLVEFLKLVILKALTFVRLRVAGARQFVGLLIVRLGARVAGCPLRFEE